MLDSVSFKNIFKNFSFLTISNFINQLVALVVLIKLAKIFNPEQYGVLTFMLTQCQMLVSIADVGLRNIVIRKIARNPENSKSIFFNAFRLKLLAYISVFSIYVLFNYFFTSLNSSQLLLIFSLLLFNCLNNLFESLYWGFQKMITTSILNILSSLFWLSFVFLVPINILNEINLFIALIIFSSIKLLLYVIIISKNQFLRGKINNFKETSIELISECWPYFSLVLLMLPSNYFSINFLDLNAGKSEVGFFNLSNKLVAPILVIINLSLSAIFPNLSILYKKSKSNFNQIVKTSFLIFGLILISICFIFCLFFENVIELIFPVEYYSVLDVSKILVWYVFFMSINTFVGTIWGASNNEKLIFKSSLVNMLIATPILFYSSYYGSLGLAYGYLIGFFIFEIFLWNKFVNSLKLDFKNIFMFWLIALFVFLIIIIIPNNLNMVFKFAILILVTFIQILYFKTNSDIVFNLKK